MALKTMHAHKHVESHRGSHRSETNTLSVRRFPETAPTRPNGPRFGPVRLRVTLQRAQVFVQALVVRLAVVAPGDVAATRKEGLSVPLAHVHALLLQEVRKRDLRPGDAARRDRRAIPRRLND